MSHTCNVTSTLWNTVKALWADGTLVSIQLYLWPLWTIPVWTLIQTLYLHIPVSSQLQLWRIFCFPRVSAYRSFDCISNTRDCFIRFPNTKMRVENTMHSRVCRVFYEKIQCVWKSDETLSQVFDISSQSKLKLRSKQRNKIIKKLMLIKIRYPNHWHGYDFLCYNLMRRYILFVPRGEGFQCLEWCLALKNLPSWFKLL